MIKIPLCFMCKHYEEGNICKAHPDGLKDGDFKLWEDKEIECGNGIFFLNDTPKMVYRSTKIFW